MLTRLHLAEHPVPTPRLTLLSIPLLVAVGQTNWLRFWLISATRTASLLSMPPVERVDDDVFYCHLKWQQQQ